MVARLCDAHCQHIQIVTWSFTCGSTCISFANYVTGFGREGFAVLSSFVVTKQPSYQAPQTLKSNNYCFVLKYMASQSGVQDLLRVLKLV